MFRVIIAGGRDFNNYALLEQTMDRLLENVQDEIVVVCGMARDADSLGEQYAQSRGYTVYYYSAKWDIYGKSAGYRRNEKWLRTQTHSSLSGTVKVEEQST